MRHLFFLLFCFVFMISSAQKTYDHELQLTETRFALESQIHGLKWGFLHNMDTAALGIGQKGFINLHSVWQARPDKSTSVLQWKPTDLFWSEDGLFGITTGPFFSQLPGDSLVMAKGYFFTIWKRNSVAERFKFIVDAGVQMVTALPPSAFVSVPVSASMIPAESMKEIDTVTQAIEQTQDFRDAASEQSLLSALNLVSTETSIVLFSDYGKLGKTELDKVKALGRKFVFVKNNKRLLGNGVYYEWGEFKETRGTMNSLLSGYYIQVWNAQERQPQLLAAVYQFNQPIKH